MNVQEKDKDYVTFLYGNKFHFILPLFLCVNSIFIGLNAFIDLNGMFVIVFAIISLPFMIMSAKSKLAKHKLEILQDKITIGKESFEKDSLHKIVIYQPITIYFQRVHSKEMKRRRIEAIQAKSEEAASIISRISKWAKENDIELEKH